MESLTFKKKKIQNAKNWFIFNGNAAIAINNAIGFKKTNK